MSEAIQNEDFTMIMEDHERKIESKEQRIREFARQFFVAIKNGVYAGKDDLSSFDFIRYVTNNCIKLSGDNPENQILLTDERRGAAAIFCDELVRFMKELKQTGKKKDAEEFSFRISNMLFSGSPSFAAELRPEDQFYFLSRMGRMEENKRFVNSAMISEIGLELTSGYGKNDYARVYEKISRATVAEQLEFLHILEKIILAAEGGSVGYSGEAVSRKVALLAKKFATDSEFPLVAARAKLVMELCDLASDPRFFETGTFAKAASYANGREYSEPVDEVFSDPSNLPFGKIEGEDGRALFEEMRRGDMLVYLKNTFGLPVEKLSVRSQVQFLEYVSTQKSEILAELGDLMREEDDLNKIAFLESFFACAEDKKTADILLRFARTAEAEKANLIFQKYQELTEKLNDAEENIRAHFAVEKTVDTRSVVQEFVKRANGALLLLLGKGGAAGIADLQVKLDEIKTEVIFFSSVFKTAFKGREAVDFADIRGLDFQKETIEQLRGQEGATDEMLEISKKNWLPRGEAGKVAVRGFREILDTGEEIDFYILRKDGHIISFVRFDKPDEAGVRYAGSFNVDPEYRGSAIGEAMIANALEQEAKKHILSATVHPGISVGTTYVERIGASITGILPNYDNSGVAFFEMICDRSGNLQFPSKKMSKEKLLAVCEKENTDFERFLKDDMAVFSFDTEQEQDAVLRAVNFFTQRGYIGTRYFANPKKPRERVYVFEKKKDEAREFAKAA